MIIPFLLDLYVLTYIDLYILIYVTVNVIKLVMIHISRLLCIMSCPIGKSDEKGKFDQIFRLFCIMFILNVEF